MRITCPNCAAQYEIDGVLIPTDGRDVQCSNCGTAWFLAREPSPPAPPRPRAPRAAAPRKAPPEAPPRDETMAGPGSTEPSKDHGADRTQRADAREGAIEGGDAPPPPVRRPTPDPATLEILRHERDRDERRRAEALRPKPEPAAEAREPRPPPEPSPPPAPPSDPRAAAAAERERMAAAAATARARRPSPPAPPDPVEPDEPPTPPLLGAARRAPADPPARVRLARRELLPDIEAINSSLRPEPEPVPATGHAGEPDAPRSSGFRTGFLSAVAVLAVPVALYLLAEPIARAVPAVAPAVTDYASWVDGERVALDRWVETLATRIAPEG